MFTTDADFQRADWPLVQNGAVNLFWKPAVLADAVDDLRKLRYRIAEVSCCSGRPVFYGQVSEALHWKERFGYHPWSGNLDALNDGFREYPFGPTGRSALVLNSFHSLAKDGKDFAHQVLDIIESAARDHLLTGKILICLVQTNDNGYECPDIGCRRANWNRQEWLRSKRGR
jgi:hypothetical protein